MLAVVNVHPRVSGVFNTEGKFVKNVFCLKS